MGDVFRVCPAQVFTDHIDAGKIISTQWDGGAAVITRSEGISLCLSEGVHQCSFRITVAVVISVIRTVCDSSGPQACLVNRALDCLRRELDAVKSHCTVVGVRPDVLKAVSSVLMGIERSTLSIAGYIADVFRSVCPVPGHLFEDISVQIQSLDAAAVFRACVVLYPGTDNNRAAEYTGALGCEHNGGPVLQPGYFHLVPPLLIDLKDRRIRNAPFELFCCVLHLQGETFSHCDGVSGLVELWRFYLDLPDRFLLSGACCDPAGSFFEGSYQPRSADRCD